MYTIVGLAVILLIFWILSAIGSLFSKKEDTSKYYEKIDNEYKLLNEKRQNLGINRPLSKHGQYPIIKFRNRYTGITKPKPWTERFDKMTYEYTEIRAGSSEYYFLNYLKKYFDKDKLSIGEHMCNWYYPDIVYADTTENLFIDIEIDEPYSLKMLEPIHFIGRDDERDNNVNQAGWHIIRFTEKQVRLYPLQCCKFFAEVISYLTLDNSFLDKFKNIDNLETEAQWDITKAKELARTKYRNSYHPNNRR